MSRGSRRGAISGTAFKAAQLLAGGRDGRPTMVALRAGRNRAVQSQACLGSRGGLSKLQVISRPPRNDETASRPGPLPWRALLRARRDLQTGTVKWFNAT